MHKVTSLLISLTLGLLMVATLVTAGLLTGMLWLYILALWIFTLLSVLFLSFYLRTYRRIMTRVGTVNERLAEIKLLQERRYQQLAQRLDTLSQGPSVEPQGTERAASGGQSSVPKISDLDHMNARVERAERRILGRLENILLDNDTFLRTTQELASECADHKKSD